MFREPFYAWQPGVRVEKIMNPSHLPQGSIFPISKSCRGLVLLSCLEYQTHSVWNPSTGEAMTLPDRIPLGADRYLSSFPLCALVSYGLSYCSKTRRHKVVRMYRVRGSASAAFCEVFVLNESTCWRPVAGNTKQLKHYWPRENCGQGAVFCNDSLHFLCHKGDITTFNVTDETFGSLKGPLISSNFELTELDGYLCAYTSNEQQWEWDMTLPKGMHAAVNKSSWIAPLDVCYDNSGQKKMIFGTGSCYAFIVDPSIGVAEILFSPDDDIKTIVCSKDNDRLPTMGFFDESLARVSNTSSKKTISSSSPSMRAWSEVLSWLPARTLGRLNQVCKGWRALIKNDETFVASHLRHANLDKSPQVMFVDGTTYGFEDVDYIIERPDATPPLIEDRLRVVCSNPCHGLNTVSFGKYDFVCNPVTGYSKVLPLDGAMDKKGSLNHAFTDASQQYNGTDIFAGRLGLGYEQETSRHLLVRLAYKERNITTRAYKLVCKMRYIDAMFWDEVDPPTRPVANMPPAYVNGKLYWMADTDFSKIFQCYEIIVLDIRTRKFGVFQGPPCNSDHVSVIELQDRLCVAGLHQSTNVMEIWEMRDDFLWSVKYHIELRSFSPEYLPELAIPLAVDPKDGRILLSTGRAFGYYDPKTMELQTIVRLGKHVKGMKFVLILYKESLVRPRDPILIF
ncbi:hypothetical protein QOZ80_2AG0112090 [Eleusine coracana subsp. coracana]|nr:hypothetical protein QOZ80_2AG0112090 [Eleusine coracana subsp. coracana]